jgi:hypothetical protein
MENQQQIRILSKEEQLNQLAGIMQALEEIAVKVKQTPTVMSVMAGLEQISISIRAELQAAAQQGAPVTASATTEVVADEE